MRRDWLQHLCLMCNIMLMRLQELYKSCACLVGRSVNFFYYGAKWQNSCATVYFILFYCKWANRFTGTVHRLTQLMN